MENLNPKHSIQLDQLESVVSVRLIEKWFIRMIGQFSQ